jgi:hypothetical protein
MLLGTLPIVVHALGGSDEYLAVLPDDAFYYFMTARNIEHSYISSFDGITRTNGYHPLWMAVVAGISRLSGGLGVEFFLVLAVVQFVACFLSFRLLLLLGRALAFPSLAALLAALGTVPALVVLSFSGMETTVALPLVILSLIGITRLAEDVEPGERRAWSLGLLFALLVLSRVDALILPALTVPWLALRPGLSFDDRLKRIAALAIGCSVAIPYFLWNLWSQGALLPVSGMAKSINSGLRFNPKVTRLLISHWPFAVGGLSVILLLRSRRPLRLFPAGRNMLFIVAACPIVQYVGFGLTSDWLIWSWYYYWLPALGFTLVGLLASLALEHPQRLEKSGDIVLVLFGIAVLVLGATYRGLKPPADSRFAQIVPPIVPIFVAIACLITLDCVSSLWLRGRRAKALHTLRSATMVVGILATSLHAVVQASTTFRTALGKGRPETIYTHGKRLAEFASTHPGRYGMGDRAGLTALLLRRPIVQLEGLVGDAALLAHIRREASLNDVLRDKEIDYLIVSVYEPLQREDSCYQVAIPGPLQSGPHSRRMRGRFCASPLFYYETTESRLGTKGCFTYVFSAR